MFVIAVLFFFFGKKEWGRDVWLRRDTVYLGYQDHARAGSRKKEKVEENVRLSLESMWVAKVRPSDNEGRSFLSSIFP